MTEHIRAIVENALDSSSSDAGRIDDGPRVAKRDDTDPDHLLQGLPHDEHEATGTAAAAAAAAVERDEEQLPAR